MKNQIKSLDFLVSNLKSIQNLRSTPLYRGFEYCYTYLLNKFFKRSCVSINFRLSIPDFINLSSEKKKIINEKLNFTLAKNKKGLSITDLENFLKEISEYNVEVDVLFMKRQVSERDKYSGNISFPGGKYEIEDKNLFNTAIRETREEIGIDLMKDLPARVICCNYSFHTPLGFKYLVTSYIFITFDFEKNMESMVKLNKDEVSDVILVPLDYLYSFNNEFDKRINKVQMKNNYFGDIIMEKLILNDNLNFQLYGMTWRMIYQILNYNKKVMYDLDFSRGYSFKFLIGFIMIKLYNFISAPLNAYNLIKTILFIFLFYQGLKTVAKF